MSVDIGRVPSVAAQTASVARSAPEESTDPRDETVATAAPREDVQLKEAGANTLLERLIDAGTKMDSRLSIDHDDITGSYVYRILDGRTGEIVRQFPYEEQLELLRFLNEQQEGVIFDQRV